MRLYQSPKQILFHRVDCGAMTINKRELSINNLVGQRQVAADGRWVIGSILFVFSQDWKMGLAHDKV